MDEQPETQYVRPETARAKVTAHTPGILITTHLWILWAHIAMRAEIRAREARELATNPDHDAATGLASEAEEALVVITAVGNLFYNLDEAWSRRLPGVETRNLPLAATTNPPKNAQEWLTSIGTLVRTRGNAVHFIESPKPVQPHPTGTHTSPENATFTVENASAAVDLMLDVLTRAIESPSVELEGWASSFGLTLEDLRKRRS